MDDLEPPNPPLAGTRVELRPFRASDAAAVADRCGFAREGVLRAWEPVKNHQPDVMMFSRLPSD